jgi:ABC-type transport system involved in cytochrome c biogenesis permease subunit
MTPPQPPNFGQLSLVIGAAALFVLGGAASLARGGRPSNALRLTAKSLAYWGICLALAALIWHGVQRHVWLPLEDNFEALTALAVLLAGFWLYVQRSRPIPGLDWFLMPIVVLMLGCAAVFATVKPSTYRPNGAWLWTHLLSTFGGVLAFAIAAGAGCMYLVLSGRLRRKIAATGPNLGNLERLEHVTQSAVSIGFALLSIGMITGLVKVLQDPHTQLGRHWMTNPKVVLAFGVWVVYALALHSPINPAFRGRKSAMLSIVGFVLMMLTTLIAVQFMPGRQ